MIAIYARQSLDKKDSISIETQIELCKKEIGDERYKEYVDRGYSGKNTNRPQFKAMMQDVENGVISKIIVYKLDRLSRSTLDFGELMDALSKHNVEFSSTREKFDTSTPIGKAMLNIIMVFAQLERETIQVRVQDNFRMRSSRGAYDAKAPYGYAKTKVMVQGKAVSTLKPDKAYSLMVKKIFEQYAYTSTSLGYLARTLNQQGIKSANGAAWDSCKLSKLLCNPIYVKADAEVYKYYRAKGMEITNDIDDFRGQYGCVTYGQWDRAKNKFAQLSGLTLSIGLHEGIIDAKTFLACQYKLADNTQINNTGRGKHSWLTGLLKCGCCGKAMKVMTYKDTATFRCSGAMNTGLCSDSPSVCVHEMEEAVEREIFAHVARHQELVVQKRKEEDNKAYNYKIAIAKLDDQIANLITALADGTELTMKYINGRISELQKQRDILAAELQQHKNATKQQGDIKQFHDIINLWPGMTIPQKHEIAMMLIKRVEIQEDTTRIYWKYDL